MRILESLTKDIKTIPPVCHTKHQVISPQSSIPNVENEDELLSENATEVWFPRHISDLDQCSSCDTKYEPEYDPNHPGFGDAQYSKRRQFLIDQALNHKYGDTFPAIEYTDSEHATWTSAYTKLRELHPIHASEIYLKNIEKLERDGVFTAERIPDVRDINDYLKEKTGFTCRPCRGYLSARDFLASMAFRVFQTATFIRHHGYAHHSPEPDLIHELLGHVPMLADPFYADFSQEIGLLSLGASDEEIKSLSSVYWYIIEFGLSRENGQIKAIGAGLVSAYGELVHSCSNKPNHVDFDPFYVGKQSYEDDRYQDRYFVAESYEDAFIKMRDYAKTFRKCLLFDVEWDTTTQTIRKKPKDNNINDFAYAATL